MKKLYMLTLIIFMATVMNAQATTIVDIQSGVNIYANSVSGSSGNFYDQSFSDFSTSSPLDATALSAAVTGGNLNSYAWTPDFHMPTDPANAYIDLSFGANIYNRDVADLVLFFAGNGTIFQNGDILPYQFTIDIGADGSNEGGIFGVTTSSTSDIYGNKFFASYAMIDLDAFGFDQHTALGDIRIYLGDITMPALSGLGAYHLTPGQAVVPLPLPIVLFSSGLALLGWIGRRKTLE